MTRRRKEGPRSDDRGGAANRASRDQIDALRALLADICAAADARALVPRWGQVVADDGRERLRMTCPADLPFTTLSFVAWPAAAYGVVDAALRDGPWRLAPLEVEFGPFESPVQLHGGPERSVASWSNPALPATALLQLWRRGDQVEAITIRRDPRLVDS